MKVYSRPSQAKEHGGLSFITIRHHLKIQYSWDHSGTCLGYHGRPSVGYMSLQFFDAQSRLVAGRRGLVVGSESPWLFTHAVTRQGGYVSTGT